MRYSDLEVGDVLQSKANQDPRLWLVVSKDGPDTVWMDLETGALAPTHGIAGLEAFGWRVFRGGESP